LDIQNFLPSVRDQSVQSYKAAGRVMIFRLLREMREKRLLASSYLSVRLSAYNSAPTGRIFMKFDI
jgi:hypothetical protein